MTRTPALDLSSTSKEVKGVGEEGSTAEHGVQNAGARRARGVQNAMAARGAPELLVTAELSES